MFQKNLQNLQQKVKAASRNILGDRQGPVDASFDRAKAQWLSLEASVRLLLDEANNYKVEMKGIGENGAQMMNKIAGMFEDTASVSVGPSLSPTSSAPGGAVISPDQPTTNDWPDPNENHPYKDVAQLMKQMQTKIQQEDIAVSSHHLTPPHPTSPSPCPVLISPSPSSPLLSTPSVISRPA
jgi:hypothetical protein